MITEPGAEGLIGKTVFVFAEVTFVNGEGRAENRGQDEELDPIDHVLQESDASDAPGKIAHSDRPPKAQKGPVDDDGHEKIPEDEPVAAFKVGIATSAGGGRNLREVSVGGSSDGEMVGGLRFRRHSDHGRHLGLREVDVFLRVDRGCEDEKSQSDEQEWFHWQHLSVKCVR